jgi:spore maturation protein A
MLNKVWCGLLVVGIAYGFVRAACHDWLTRGAEPAAPAEQPYDGAPSAAARAAAPEPPPPGEAGLVDMGRALNAAALDAAKSSVEICIGLIGIMALWLGLLNIAREAGLVDALARLLRPLMRWLFPEVPDGHPAQGAMLMNLSANMLGLENAATPLGLKAMEELQTLNPQKDTATNSMAMFLAINTSNVTLIPFTIIGYRLLSGSQDPARPMFAIFLTTLVATVVAVVAARTLQRLPQFASPPAAPPAVDENVPRDR